MENRTTVIATVVTVLALMGTLAAWVYTELKTITQVQAQDEIRQVWLERWDNERKNRLESLENRIHRLESNDMEGKQEDD